MFFALLLIHRVRPDIKPFGWARFLMLLCIDSGLIVILQCASQLVVPAHTRESITASLNIDRSSAPSALEDSHLVRAVFGSASASRVPAPSICAQHGSSGENRLELIEGTLLRTNHRIDKEGCERQ